MEDSTPPIPYPSADAAARPKRKWWKWSLALSAILVIFLMWQGGSALRQARVLADPAVETFHKKMNAGQFDQICGDADENFALNKQAEVVKFLEAAHTKLGDAGTSSQANILVNSTTSGTFIVVRYNTTFSRGSAVETFSFIRSGGTLKLHGYHIESNALIVN